MNPDIKNLILVTSHRQVDEFQIYSHFLNKTDEIRNFDLLMHVNNPDVDVYKIKNAFESIPNANKDLIFTSKNRGYKLGPHEAICDLYDRWKSYDNVIHMHSDVFIINEKALLNIVNNNQEYSFLLSQCNLPSTMLSTDLFIFRPKLLKTNLFENYSNKEYENSICEEFLELEIEKNQQSHIFIKRYENGVWYPRRPCLWGCWHEHELGNITKSQVY